MTPLGLCIWGRALWRLVLWRLALCTFFHIFPCLCTRLCTFWELFLQKCTKPYTLCTFFVFSPVYVQDFVHFFGFSHKNVQKPLRRPHTFSRTLHCGAHTLPHEPSIAAPTHFLNNPPKKQKLHRSQAPMPSTT